MAVTTREWAKARNSAIKSIRSAHPGEYETLMAKLKPEVADWSQRRNRAVAELKNRYPAEFDSHMTAAGVGTHRSRS